MIAFRIRLNGRKVSTAGLPGYHVVSAIATSVLRRPDVVGKARGQRSVKPELKFELGGLWTSPDGAREHVSWTNIHKLKAGDRLSLEIVDTESADEPLHRSRTEAFTIETAERNQLRHLLKKYGRTSSTASGRRHNKALQRTGRRPARR
jgi:hypothetical protein